MQKEYEMIQKLRHQTVLDIYAIQINDQKYIVKAFRPQFHSNYQAELLILKTLDHPAIPKPIELAELNFQPSQTLKKLDLIIFKQARFGDLFTYLHHYGSFNEKVAKNFIIQIVDCLKYANEFKIYHPNLSMENILMTDNRNLQLCGWSNSIGSKAVQKQDIAFVIGQLLICMIISHMPFSCKNSKVDPYFKFVNPKHIHKLWEQLQRKIKKNRKQFQFSSELKQFVQNLFFGKIIDFSDILSCDWLKDPLPNSQLELFLSNQEKENMNFKTNRLNQVNERKQKEKEALEQIGLPSMSRSQELQMFLHEYEEMEEYDITQSTFEDAHFQKLFDSRPNMIVSHLRAQLRKFNDNFSSELFHLSKWQVVKCKQGIQVKLSLLKEIEEFGSVVEPINFGCQIQLRRREGQLFGKILAKDSQLNKWCQRILIECFKEVLME